MVIAPQYFRLENSLVLNSSAHDRKLTGMFGLLSAVIFLAESFPTSTLTNHETHEETCVTNHVEKCGSGYSLVPQQSLIAVGSAGLLLPLTSKNVASGDAKHGAIHVTDSVPSPRSMPSGQGLRGIYVPTAERDAEGLCPFETGVNFTTMSGESQKPWPWMTTLHPASSGPDAGSIDFT